MEYIVQKLNYMVSKHLYTYSSFHSIIIFVDGLKKRILAFILFKGKFTLRTLNLSSYSSPEL